MVYALRAIAIDRANGKQATAGDSERDKTEVWEVAAGARHYHRVVCQVERRCPQTARVIPASQWQGALSREGMRKGEMGDENEERRVVNSIERVSTRLNTRHFIT